MNTNHNITTNISDIINYISYKWRYFSGCLFIMGLELLGFIHLDVFSLLPLPIAIESYISAVILTILLWKINTGRWFQRTSYWAILWIIVSLGIGLFFCNIIYQNIVLNTCYDIAFIQYWGSVCITIISFLLYYYIDFKCIHRKNIVIIFLIADAGKYENNIKTVLKEVRHRIENIDNSISILIPPFGIASSLSECERYINSRFCQADAVIYTRVIEGTNENEFKFVDFTSRMNLHRVPRNHDNINVGYLLSEASKCKEWNTLNKCGDNIRIKEIVANDLSQLLLMYVGCILLYKKNYSDAIQIVDKLFDYDNREHPKLKYLTHEIVSYAYLTAAQWEEQNTHNYEQALVDLETCKSKLPQITENLRVTSKTPCLNY